jgi:RNA polymerase sigma factor (TIGR02999 family)
VNADPTQVTELLQKLGSGDKSVVDSLMPLIYEHLKRIALGQLKSERPDHTLNATALVHEAFLKMVDQRSTDWKGRAHFLAVASQAMRRILTDYARSRIAEKRGGGAPIVTFNDEVASSQARAEELIALDLALDTLEKVDPRQRQIVEYHFFGGLTHIEIAELLGVAEVTVRRDWRHARAWLSQRLGAL